MYLSFSAAADLNCYMDCLGGGVIKTLKAIAILSIFVSANAYACSCMGRGNFEEYAKSSVSVVLVELVSVNAKPEDQDVHPSMKVKVLETIRGVNEYESITLLGDPGWLCRSYINPQIHKAGRLFLVALVSDAAEQEFGGCGESYLHVKDGFAVSYRRYKDGKYLQSSSVSLEELIGKLK